mgnify:CR=1 FL=1
MDNLSNNEEEHKVFLDFLAGEDRSDWRSLNEVWDTNKTKMTSYLQSIKYNNNQIVALGNMALQKEWKPISAIYMGYHYLTNPLITLLSEILTLDGGWAVLGEIRRTLYSNPYAYSQQNQVSLLAALSVTEKMQKDEGALSVIRTLGPLCRTNDLLNHIYMIAQNSLAFSYIINRMNNTKDNFLKKQVTNFLGAFLTEKVHKGRTDDDKTKDFVDVLTQASNEIAPQGVLFWAIRGQLRRETDFKKLEFLKPFFKLTVKEDLVKMFQYIQNDDLKDFFEKDINFCADLFPENIQDEFFFLSKKYGFSTNHLNAMVEKRQLLNGISVSNTFNERTPLRKI